MCLTGIIIGITAIPGFIIGRTLTVITTVGTAIIAPTLGGATAGRITLIAQHITHAASLIVSAR